MNRLDHAAPSRRPANLVSVRRAVPATMEQLEGRALFAAGALLSDYYTAGKGGGLNIQKLPGYEFATTYGTVIAGGTGNSALDNSNPETGKSPVLPGFAFGRDNLVGYDPVKGGATPWTSQFGPTAPVGLDKEYIKANAPDSANTATTIYSGVKSYNNALGVDVYERAVENIFDQAAEDGKSTGVVSSVPLNHATPAAAYAHVNRRSKYDAVYPGLDNILQQGLRHSQPTVLLGGGHPTSGVGNTYVTPETYNALKDPADPNGYGYDFVERGPDAAATLAAAAAGINPDAGERLLGLYGARGQDGNLPWGTANGDYGNAGLQNRLDTARPLDPGETDAAFIARERNENPTLADLTSAALTVLEKDGDGFVAMIEGGDIDFAAHDDAIDNMIGKVLEFDAAVGRVQKWIEANGGYDRNVLIVTADHDHYLTLNDNFPTQLRTIGAEAMQAAADPATAGHFWGSDPAVKNGYGSHTNRPVPVYYAGPKSVAGVLDAKTGKGFDAYGVAVPGVPGAIDQTHLYQTMDYALTSPKSTAKNVIIMIGDGMGWEMARAGAIQKQIDAPTASLASGTLTVKGSPNGDAIDVRRSGGNLLVTGNGKQIGSFNNALVTTVFVDGRGGDDSIVVDANVDRRALLRGGDGADAITAGGARSILTGDAGADALKGGGRDDILIGGNTARTDAQLLTSLGVWASNATTTQRINAVRVTLGPTVQNDRFADRLTGNAGIDWFFKSGDDSILDVDSREVVN